MDILGVVQARMGSTRLPGKVLTNLGGNTVLGRVVRAARESGTVDDLVVATTTGSDDDAIVAECERLGVAWYRGDADDVLIRFLGALEQHPADAVMRFTADSPMLDPEIIALVGQTFRAVAGLDYLSTSIAHTLPRGLDAEVIRASALRTIGDLATGHHRIHVTSYAYTHPETFRVLGLTLAPDRSHLRLTLDTAEDWALVEAVVAQFGDVSVPLAKVAEWLADNPDVRQLNAGVAQRALDEA